MGIYSPNFYVKGMILKVPPISIAVWVRAAMLKYDQKGQYDPTFNRATLVRRTLPIINCFQIQSYRCDSS